MSNLTLTSYADLTDFFNFFMLFYFFIHLAPYFVLPCYNSIVFCALFLPRHLPLFGVQIVLKKDIIKAACSQPVRFAPKFTLVVWSRSYSEWLAFHTPSLHPICHVVSNESVLSGLYVNKFVSQLSLFMIVSQCLS